MSGAHAHEDETDAKPDARLLRRLVGYLGPYKLQVAVSLFLLFSVFKGRNPEGTEASH